MDLDSSYVGMTKTYVGMTESLRRNDKDLRREDKWFLLSPRHLLCDLTYTFVTPTIGGVYHTAYYSTL